MQMLSGISARLDCVPTELQAIFPRTSCASSLWLRPHEFVIIYGSSKTYIFLAGPSLEI